MKPYRSMLAGAALCLSQLLPAWGGVMSFGSGVTVGVFASAPWVENGITATPTSVSAGGAAHFDILDIPALNASPSERNAAIHRGNGGESVRFTYTSPFKLDSIDIEFFDSAPLFYTLTSSAGGVITTNALGTVTFGGPQWSNLTYVDFSVPLGNYVCDNIVDCSGVEFDNVTISSTPSAPEPATAGVGAVATGVLSLIARRRIAMKFTK